MKAASLSHRESISVKRQLRPPYDGDPRITKSSERRRYVANSFMCGTQTP